MFYLPLFFILLLLCLPGISAYAHTGITVKASNPKLARHMEDLFKTHQSRLEYIFGSQLPHITIEVAADKDAMSARLRQLNAPLWAAGVAVPSYNLVLLKPPHLLNGDENIESLLLHEAAHLYLNQALGGARAPWWLSEGSAMQAARESSLGRQLAMGRAAVMGSLLPPSAMDENYFPPAGQVDLAYAEAYYLALYLEEKAPNSLSAIISGLSKGYDINRSVYEATGKSFGLWEHDFIKDMESRFSWVALGAGGGLWAVLSVLAAIALVWRRRKIVAQMQQMGKIKQILLITRPVKAPRIVRGFHFADKKMVSKATLYRLGIRKD